jgi:hypothetical protein
MALVTQATAHGLVAQRFALTGGPQDHPRRPAPARARSLLRLHRHHRLTARPPGPQPRRVVTRPNRRNLRSACSTPRSHNRPHVRARRGVYARLGRATRTRCELAAHVAAAVADGLVLHAVSTVDWLSEPGMADAPSTSPWTCRRPKGWAPDAAT